MTTIKKFSNQLDANESQLIQSLNALTKVNLKEFKNTSEFIESWAPWSQ